MKTIFSLLFSLVAVLGLNAQCETWFTQSFSDNTGAFQAYYYDGTDTLNSPTDAQYIWTIGETTLTGEVISFEFEYDVLYNICLTASGTECTATYCDSVYITNGQVEDSCNMFLTYNIIHAYDFETADGAIDITVQGGVAPYSYYWSNEETTEDIEDLYSGTYYVSVLDSDQCVIAYSFYVAGINDSTYTDSTVVDYFYANAYYNFEGEEDCTATVYAEPFGGTAPYSYMWSNGQSTANINNACGDDFYCVTITDADGLEAEACVFIDYYNNQDSTWVVNDTLETIIDTCLDEIVVAEIIDYLIEDGYFIVTWEFVDSDDEVITFTITYPAEDSITAGAYEFYLFINCGDFKSLTTYSDVIIVTEDQLTGILTIQDDIEYTLYPNPVTNILNLELYSNDYDNTNLQIINSTGQIVYSENININSGYNKIEFNVDNLTSGMYFVRISGNETYKTMRFVK